MAKLTFVGVVVVEISSLLVRLLVFLGLQYFIRIFVLIHVKEFFLHD